MTAPALTGPGTPEVAWRAAGLPGALPVVDIRRLVPPSGRVVLLAPHPDDEVLGCGGTVALLRAAGCRVEVVAVTDGEASHPGRTDELRALRVGERGEALRLLNLSEACVHRLGLPDSGVVEDDVVAGAAPLVGDGDLVLAPWVHDGHPDHDAVGRAALRLGGRHAAYLVWAWHWCTPADLPVASAVRVALPSDVAAAKRAATTAFASQLEGPDPILPAHVLDRLLRDDEVLVR